MSWTGGNGRDDANDGLGVGTRTVWRLVEVGVMPKPVRFSRKLLRFDGAQLVRWMRERADDAQRADDARRAG